MRIIKSLNDIFQLEKEQIISASCSQMLQNDFKISEIHCPSIQTGEH